MHMARQTKAAGMMIQVLTNTFDKEVQTTWHDDLAQDPLLVPRAVVEPFDLQSGHVLQDQP